MEYNKYNGSEIFFQDLFPAGPPAGAPPLRERYRVHLLALGDVGSTLAMGLRLLGGGRISTLGICDVREGVPQRWEFELNQIISPGGDRFPRWKSWRRTGCWTATCSCSAPPGLYRTQR